jgi:predicted glycoside hydrolase/deacetylase ChbG (UPF0249 family)
MMNVIINADDLGMSEKVNKATFDLMLHRIVTSATILSNGPYVKEAIEGCKRFPDCSFGVHLNLTEFKPLSRHEGLRELLGEDGQFIGLLDRDPRKVKKTRRLLSAMADEWCHQIDYLQRWGVQISHLDSHQHVHTIPFMFPVLKYIQAKYGIRKVRSTRNVYHSGAKLSSISLWAKRVYRFSLRNFYSTRTTDAFMDFCTFYERVVVEKQTWPSVEVMVHPGSGRDDENRLLYSNWRCLLADKINLINYKSL